MSQFFEIHPDNPQPRLVKLAAQCLAKGGVVAIPTDSSYALICHLDDKSAVDQLRRIRQMEERHHLSLLCSDLSELANYARVNNRQYRMLKLGTPGPYTFILDASKEVPRRVSHPSRKTIGLRVPAHRVTQALLQEVGAPVLSTSLILPGQSDPLSDAHEIREELEHQVAAVIDAGPCALDATTVVDLTPMNTGGEAELIRQGAGPADALGL